MKSCRSWLLLLAILVLGNGAAKAQSATKILDHGPDGEKLTFVVMGDGYAAADQTKFSQDVDKLVTNGVFGHDFYKDNIEAFNLYRVDLISKQSGVSSLKFSKNTALKVIYSGRWDRCWLEGSPDTDQLIAQAMPATKIDYVLVIANENGYGGCRRGSRLFVTSGSPWDVVAHEYGHGIAGLYDEYSVSGAGVYSGDSINVKNCSVVLDKDSVVWGQLIQPNIALPSDSARNVDANLTVGEFTGCNYAEKAIYRPVKECRMNSTAQLFCPVCLSLMKSVVEPFLAPKPAPPPDGFAAPPGQSESNTTYLNMVVRISKHEQVAVLKATELKGAPVASQQASPASFFAFTRNNEPSFVDLLPEDPYLVRGFVDPEHRDRGEKLSQADSATIIVTVPKTSVFSATQGVGLQLYSVKPGTVTGIPGIYELNSKDKDVLRNLLQGQSVKMELNVSPGALAAAVSSKSGKVDPQ
jgi:hypothetical protein